MFLGNAPCLLFDIYISNRYRNIINLWLNITEKVKQRNQLKLDSNSYGQEQIRLVIS